MCCVPWPPISRSCESDEFVKAMAKVPVKTQGELADRFDALMKDERRSVADAMRNDMGVGKGLWDE
jgi:hypothetical protein